MNVISDTDFPLTVTDTTCIFEMRLNYGSDGGCKYYLIGNREHLDLKKLVKKALVYEYGTDFGIRKLRVETPRTGGPNECAIRTMDDIETRKFHTREHLERELDACCVVWTSGDFYFDLEG